MRSKLDIFKLFTEKIFILTAFQKVMQIFVNPSRPFAKEKLLLCMFNTFCQAVGLVLEMKLRVGFNSLLKIL